MYFSLTCIFFNKINKIMEVYSLPCLKKKILEYENFINRFFMYSFLMEFQL